MHTAHLESAMRCIRKIECNRKACCGDEMRGRTDSFICGAKRVALERA